MDKFVTITRTTTLSNDAEGSEVNKKKLKYNPYPIPKSRERQVDAQKDKKRIGKILAPLREQKAISANSKALTKHLLNTLKDEANLLTHSTIGQRSDHVDSCATGHQRSDGRRSGIYFKSRAKKLEEQRQEKGRDANGVLKGIKIYVGGYLAGTTDIEIKRIVTLAGGKIMHTAAGATHILTSQGLSGSKTHKYLHAASARNKVHIVTPKWALDSIAAGKLKREWDYAVIKDSTYNLGEPSVAPQNID